MDGPQRYAISNRFVDPLLEQWYAKSQVASPTNARYFRILGLLTTPLCILYRAVLFPRATSDTMVLFLVLSAVWVVCALSVSGVLLAPSLRYARSKAVLFGTLGIALLYAFDRLYIDADVTTAIATSISSYMPFLGKMNTLPSVAPILLASAVSSVMLVRSWTFDMVDLALLLAINWIFTVGAIIFVRDLDTSRRGREANLLFLSRSRLNSVRLLANLVPPAVAGELLSSNCRQVLADAYEKVTLLFIYVDTADLERDLDAEQFAKTLGELYALFDRTRAESPGTVPLGMSDSQLDVGKRRNSATSVRSDATGLGADGTRGSATDNFLLAAARQSRTAVSKVDNLPNMYIAATGTQPHSEAHQAQAAALFALNLLRAVGKAFPMLASKIRIGINTGKATAGIVGKQALLYSFYGDTVNTASRVASSCEMGTAQLSPSAMAALRFEGASRHFRTHERGPIAMKGKGDVTVHVLDGLIGQKNADAVLSAAPAVISMPPGKAYRAAPPPDSMRMAPGALPNVPEDEDLDADVEVIPMRGPARRDSYLPRRSVSALRRSTADASSEGGDELQTMLSPTRLGSGRRSQRTSRGTSRLLGVSERESADMQSVLDDLLQEDPDVIFAQASQMPPEYAHSIWTGFRDGAIERAFRETVMPLAARRFTLLVGHVLVVQALLLVLSLEPAAGGTADAPLAVTAIVLSAISTAATLAIWALVALLPAHVTAGRPIQMVILLLGSVSVLVGFAVFAPLARYETQRLVLLIANVVLLAGSGVISFRDTFFWAAANGALCAAALLLLADPLRDEMNELTFATRLSAVIFFCVLFIAILLLIISFMESAARVQFVLESQQDAELERISDLLHSVLPPRVVDQMNRRDDEGNVRAVYESFDDVVMLATDVAGFTAMSSTMTPANLFGALNEMYEEFDAAAVRYGAEKLGTIGDAYLACNRLPRNELDVDVRSAADRAADLVAMSIDMCARMSKRAFGPTARELQIRLGVHCGSLHGCLLGHAPPSYRTWGETSDGAQKLEQTSERMNAVHVSGTVADLLEAYHKSPNRPYKFHLEPSGVAAGPDGRPTFYASLAQ